MACSCKHNQQEIQEGRRLLAFFRKLFIQRMTVDSDHNDRRRKDFNQAIFFYDDYTHEHKQCFCGTNMEMVLQCFDDAVYDWRKPWCYNEKCKRNGG
jgi:hypothetical protein